MPSKLKELNRQALVDALNQKFGQSAEVFEDNTNLSIKVAAAKLLDVARELHDNPDYDFTTVMNLTAVDYPENFTVVYHLLSLNHYHKVTIKVELTKEKPEVPSVESVWKAANVQEREVYDLMGVVFTGHPNLKRILLSDDFTGHPLRKDWKMEAKGGAVC